VPREVVVKRALAWIAGVVVVLLVLWGAMHVFLSPVNPEQEPPEGHFSSACWGCHLVLSSAEIR
jgi:hypothetical protein